MVILRLQGFHYFADSRLYVLPKSYMENDVWTVKVSLGDPPRRLFFSFKQTIKEICTQFHNRRSTGGSSDIAPSASQELPGTETGLDANF